MFWKKKSGSGLSAEISREMKKVQKENANQKPSVISRFPSKELSALKDSLSAHLDTNISPRENPCKIDNLWFGVVPIGHPDDGDEYFRLYLYFPCTKCSQLRPHSQVSGALTYEQMTEVIKKFPKPSEYERQEKLESKMRVQNAKKRVAKGMLQYQDSLKQGRVAFDMMCPHCGANKSD